MHQGRLLWMPQSLLEQTKRTKPWAQGSGVQWAALLYAGKCHDKSTVLGLEGQ